MRLYTCSYCYKEFDPKQINVQKHCSNTCRSKAYHQRSKVKIKKTELPEIKEDMPLPPDNLEKKTTKVEAMSVSGIGQFCCW